MTRRAVAVLAFVALAGCSSAEAGRGSVRAPAHAPSPLPASPRPAGGAAPALPAGGQPAAQPVAKAVPTPCAADRRPQWVLVSLKRQHLWMCAHGLVVRDTAITSGMLGQYTETPTGRYVIQGKTRDTSLTLLSGETYAVKYWIPFDGPLYGFHDSSWQAFPYGSPKYESQGSHGCVHVPLAAIRFLYRWAKVGTVVRIRA